MSFMYAALTMKKLRKGWDMESRKYSKMELMHKILSILDEDDRIYPPLHASSRNMIPDNWVSEMAAMDITRTFVRTLNMTSKVSNGVIAEFETWRILLELYMSSFGPKKVSVSDIALLISMPSTTTLRWLSILQDRNLIIRCPDPTDKRRVWLELSAYGRKCLETWISSMIAEFSRVFTQIATLEYRSEKTAPN